MSYSEFPFQNLPQTLTVQEVRNPFMVVTAFFDNYHLPEAVKLLDKWMRSAFAGKSRLGKTDILSILHLQDELIRLLEAGQLMNDDPANDEKALDLNTSPDITNTALYYRPHKVVSPWDCFPRQLSAAEFANPYLVFQKCLRHFDLGSWRATLKDLFDAATANGLITEMVLDADMYTTQKYLFKLLYACHLIKVRHIDPHITPEPEGHNPKSPLQPAAQLHTVSH